MQKFKPTEVCMWIAEPMKINDVFKADIQHFRQSVSVVGSSGELNKFKQKSILNFK